SKWCGAGGWRVGTFLFPPGLRWLLEAMAAAASETYTSTCAPVQYASVAAFGESPELERYLETSRRVLHALGVRIHQQLVGAGLHCAEPAGGFYLFPDFGSMREGLAARGVETSEALCKQLLEDTGVAILPGSAFGRPEAELTTRLAYVDFDGAAALEAAAGQPLNGAFLEARCARVVEAVERLVRWLP
ncbi:MAG: aminotransferase class I/II-fold pyridoxal phosphate-dependent enzyme, partial [Myxococcales bacterium]|nr:aminotransferase class I/II-fold pyridoxal phosphate-dependent enzyme [Myxococcales bacterium]